MKILNAEESMLSEDNMRAIAEIDDIVVGFLGIHRRSKRMTHVGELGIMIHPDYQRKGIGTKLLKAAIKLASIKGYRRLEADTLATNVAMRKTARKLGSNLKV